MHEKYANLLNEIEEISHQSYALSEVLYGYCEFLDGKKVSSVLISDFFKEIRDKQLGIIRLIDKKSTEITHEILVKRQTL